MFSFVIYHMYKQEYVLSNAVSVPLLQFVPLWRSIKP